MPEISALLHPADPKSLCSAKELLGKYTHTFKANSTFFLSRYREIGLLCPTVNWLIDSRSPLGQEF